MDSNVRIRVRYAESDQMGVAYYSNYLVWFEMARTELLRGRGFPYSKMEEDGFFLPVSECYSKYVLPAHYDELLEVRCRVGEVRTRAVRFEYKILREGTLLARGHTVHVCTDRNARPRTIPSMIREALLEAAGEGPFSGGHRSCPHDSTHTDAVECDPEGETSV
ncbi:MAG: thioesterase family protein [Candidatus Eisenbacteria bacterium]